MHSKPRGFFLSYEKDVIIGAVPSGNDMTLLDGGSKQNWAERTRARSHWVVFFLIPLFTAAQVARSLEKHDGLALRWICLGLVFLGLALWRHRNLN